MPEIHIEREHDMGLAQARKLAFKWAETAEQKLGMECVYEEGKTSDLVTFTRSGVNGELKVTRDSFVLDARLGLLLGAFKERIQTEIVKNLDRLLAEKDPHKAWDKAVAKHGAPLKDKEKPARHVPAKEAAPAKKAGGHPKKNA